MAGKRNFVNFDEKMISTSGFICAKTMTYITKMHRDKHVQNLIYSIISQYTLYAYDSPFH